VPVDFARELVITDLPVVENPCRTTWSAAGCPLGTRGTWTFKHLMTQMAGSVPAQAFVAELLNTFMTPQPVSTVPSPGAAPLPTTIPALPPRPLFRARFLDPWLIASGCAAGAPIVGPGACALNLDLAPFRLLAIVNRVDLSEPVAPGSSAGEGRFVFGLYNALTGAPHAATIIFEYDLPPPRDAFAWENDWHALSGLGAGTPAYLSTLGTVTGNFTRAGAYAGRPNGGSAIAQVRTNEIEYGAQWVMREYTLHDVGLGLNRQRLLPDTTKLTPIDSANLTADLDGWLTANAPAIDALTHSVPLLFPSGATALGGQASAPMIWSHTGALPASTRHFFGLATCNGCHTEETDTLFLHVAPRPPGARAALSPFLGVSPAPGVGGLPASSHAVTDPVTGGIVRYNEPWRRVCEATRLLRGDPTPFTNGAGVH
jgi:hypothetical protein